MLENPIFQPEPLPGETSSQPKFAHSTYEQARMRALQDSASDEVAQTVLKAHNDRKWVPNLKFIEPGQPTNPSEPGKRIAATPIMRARNAPPINPPRTKSTSFPEYRGGKSQLAGIIPGGLPNLGKSLDAPSEPYLFGVKSDEQKERERAATAAAIAAGTATRYEGEGSPKPKSKAELAVETNRLAQAPHVETLFKEQAAKYPSAHPEEIRQRTEKQVNAVFGRNTHRNHTELLSSLANKLGYDEGPTPNHPRHAAMLAYAEAGNKLPNDWQSRSDDEIEEDPQTKAAPRKRSARYAAGVTDIARVLTRKHYKDNFEGKEAPATKGPFKGELVPHPTFENSRAHRNPIQYMKEHMGIADPETHIIHNHMNTEDPGLGRSEDPRKAPPAEKSKEFIQTYAKNPLAAVFAEASTHGRR